MQNPTDRQLCERLAQWAGVEIHWSHEGQCWASERPFKPGSDEPWNPLIDANQMALAEAGLRKAGIDYYLHWSELKQQHHFALRRAAKHLGSGSHTGKLLAMALAVWELGEPKEWGESCG